MKLGRAWGPSLVAIALGFVMVPACGRRTRDEPAEPSRAAPSAAPERRVVHVDPALVDEGRVKTQRVTRRRASGALRLPADVVASAEGAAEAGSLLGGRVARFEKREGDRVKRGEVLAWIAAPEAAHAVADFVRARSRIEPQTRKVRRLEGLVAVEAATQAALEEARLDLDLARSDLAAARTIMTSLGLREPPPIADTGAPPSLSAQLPVKSPVDGVVVDRVVPLGAHVTPSMHLFRIVSEGRVLVDARIPDGARVPSPGTPARLRPHENEACDAEVLGVLPEVEPATRSRKVRVAPRSPCAGLFPGAQAEVELTMDAGTGESTVIPARALTTSRTASIVFVATGAKGTFEVRPVEPGPRIGDDVTIAMGVDAGEEVVVDGTVLLKGELIRAEPGGEL